MLRITTLLFAAILFAACQEKGSTQPSLSEYFQYDDKIESAGIQMKPIKTQDCNVKV